MGGDADSEATMQRLQDILVKMTQFQVLVGGGAFSLLHSVTSTKSTNSAAGYLVKMTQFQVLVGGGGGVLSVY
jgi:hypothetical protein